jgi:hypothetical protein
MVPAEAVGCILRDGWEGKTEILDGGNLVRIELSYFLSRR